MADLPPEERPNIRPTDIPGLRAQENGGGSEMSGSALGGKTDNSNSGAGLGGSGTATPTSKALAAAESGKSPDAAAVNANKGGGNFAFNAMADTTPVGRLVSMLKRNKGKAGAGGIAGISSILIAIFGFGAIVSYELVTIEKDLLQYEAKAEQFFEKKVAKKVSQKIICRALPISKKCKGDPEDNKENSEAQDAAAEAAGEDLTADLDKFSFTDPDVVTALKGEGITVNIDKDGQFTGITDDQTGKDVTDDIGTDDALFERFETALPEYSVGQVESFRSLLTDEAGASFAGLPDNDDENVDKDIQNEITEGADPAQLELADAENGDPDPGVNGTQAQQDAYNADSQATGKLEAAESATEEVIEKGGSEAEALSAGEKAFGLAKDPLVLSTILTDVCSVKNAADGASKSRVPEIMKLLVRHSTLILSLADQLKSGNIKGSEVSKVMKLFNGDSSAKPTTSDPNPEAAMPFSQSAAWQRISGHSSSVDSAAKDSTKSSYTPDISKSSLPTANGGTKIVDDVDSAVDKTGAGNLLCKAATSALGGLFQAAAGVVQFFADDFSFGAAEAATVAAVVSVQETLQHVIIPEILEYFTPVGLDGNEDAVSWMNNADAGTNLSENMYAKRLGGEPQTKKVANKVYAEASTEENTIESQESWSDRTFALSNPDSLVSRLALDIPTSKVELLSGFSDYFTNLPKSIENSFATIFMSHQAFAADDTENPGAAYGITQYGFDGDETHYDMVANEQYLFSPITITDTSGTAHSVSRILMTGNPNDYPNSAVDPSTTDLLHCFTEGFDDGSNPEANQTSGSNDPICASMGSYDYDNDNPQPMTDDNVVTSYCDYLTANYSINNCSGQVAPQLDNDIGRFRQYLLDVHVMGDYTSLTSDSTTN